VPAAGLADGGVLTSRPDQTSCGVSLGASGWGPVAFQDCDATINSGHAAPQHRRRSQTDSTRGFGPGGTIRRARDGDQPVCSRASSRHSCCPRRVSPSRMDGVTGPLRGGLDRGRPMTADSEMRRRWDA
jgi:hypothetical protein